MHLLLKAGRAVGRTFMIGAATIFALAALPPATEDSKAGNVAVVVRMELPVDNLSFGEVRQLLLGDRQFWTAGVRVTLLMRAPAAREREVILKTVYRMSETEFRRYWIEKVFRAEDRLFQRGGDRAGGLHPRSSGLRGCQPGAEGAEGATDRRTSAGRQRISAALAGWP